MNLSPFFKKKRITLYKPNKNEIYNINTVPSQIYFLNLYKIWENKVNKLFLKKIQSNLHKLLDLENFNIFYLQKWISFVNTYNIILNKSFLDLFLYTKIFLNIKKFMKYSIIFNFSKSKLFLNIKNNFNKNYLSLSLGHFLKFYKNKKSLKKNKTLKLVMMKYLRKLLIITKIKNFNIRIRGIPTYIYDLINTLLKPLSHSFVNVFDNKIIDETKYSLNNLNILYFVFDKNKPFGFMKNKKKGRIKRKILKRVIRTNRLVD